MFMIYSIIPSSSRPHLTLKFRARLVQFQRPEQTVLRRVVKKKARLLAIDD